jgi:hypothetical protein
VPYRPAPPDGLPVNELREVPLRFWPGPSRAQDPRKYVDPTWDPVERHRVLNYLADSYETGYLNPSPLRWCAFGCANPMPRGTSHGLTDGTWQFPETLIHYLEEHAVKPPSEFLTHVRSNGYHVPDLANEGTHPGEAV